MQKESKLLAWFSVILLNVIVLLLILVDTPDLFENPYYFISASYPFFIGSILVTVVPTLVSYIKGGWKKYITYGVPLVSLLSIIGGFIQMYTCTGKMCGILGLILMLGAGIVLIFFPLSYALAQYAAPKKSYWIYIVLALEIIAVVWLSYGIVRPTLYM